MDLIKGQQGYVGDGDIINLFDYFSLSACPVLRSPGTQKIVDNVSNLQIFLNTGGGCCWTLSGLGISDIRWICCQFDCDIGSDCL